MSTSASVVDWPAAARVAGRIAPPGPTRSRVELQELIDELRLAADRAWPLAVASSGLGDIVGDAAVTAPVFVVDRSGWARANSSSMDRLSAPLLAGAGEQKTAAQVVATVEAAGILSVLSTKVLGQFDPYGDQDGRLLLVAPNILDVESVMGVPAEDFRLWVCLHELTHAAQFQAAPWLSDHIVSLVQQLGRPVDEQADQDESTDEDAGALSSAKDTVAHFAANLVRAGRFVKSGVDAARGRSQAGLMDGMLSEAQRERLGELTAIMALLEGHADVTMDAVGPDVIGSVDELREAFEHRRDSSKGMARVFSRLLGMDAKLAQYRNGAVFVRQVQDKVGATGLAAAWQAPENLPTGDEILDPEQWVKRVHG